VSSQDQGEALVAVEREEQVEDLSPGGAVQVARGLVGEEQAGVAIARALINTPELLLADEPTGNVDPGSAAGILDLLSGLRIEHTMTVVLASHDPQVAARCERLIRLAGGRITADIQLTGGEPSASILRQVGQLG
jgi:putative ABC transport system ATP-binding protein